MTRRHALAGAVLALAGALASACASGGSVLVVEDLARRRVLHREPVVPGAVLVLSYVHSSEHVPVRGTLRVERDRTLTVAETAFAGFGPGLPALHAGDDWRLRDGLIVARGGGDPLPELRVRVLPITRHRVRFPSGRELDLSALMGAGGPVRLRVEPVK